MAARHNILSRILPAFLIGLAKAEAPAAVVLSGDHLGRRLYEASIRRPVGHQSKFHELEIRECRTDLVVAIDAVSVEADARPPDRNGEKQLAFGRKHARQLVHRFDIAFGIEGITVTAQADMLHHVHARQARNAAARKRQRRQIGKAGAYVVEAQVGRAIVIMIHGHERRHYPNEIEG